MGWQAAACLKPCKLPRGRRCLPTCAADAPRIPVRLTGSGRAAEGRLEVYHNGLWAPVNSSPNMSAVAEVACRQLGYSRSTWMQHAVYMPGLGEPRHNGITCRGTESSVLECSYDGLTHVGIDVNVACSLASGVCSAWAAAGRLPLGRGWCVTESCRAERVDGMAGGSRPFCT